VLRPFISYAREDREVALRLSNDLRAAGITPWIDVADLIGGQEWDLAIREALRKSSHCILLISHHSVTKRGYVQKEIREALDLLSELPPNGVFVVPVRLDDSEPLHDLLRRLHWIDLFTDYADGLAKVITSLRADFDATDHSQETLAELRQQLLAMDRRIELTRTYGGRGFCPWCGAFLSHFKQYLDQVGPNELHYQQAFAHIKFECGCDLHETVQSGVFRIQHRCPQAPDSVGFTHDWRASHWGPDFLRRDK
jgi:hypothetical protein